ncbi:MAG: SOS response-associated peptidase family protein, partial [Candidatus Methylomirabilis sp.]
MCGRYTYTADEFSDLRIRFNLERDLPFLAARYNIAPGQDVPVIINHENTPDLKLLHWGLIPSWAKDPSIGNKMINARCETFAEKPSFKRLIGKK